MARFINPDTIAPPVGRYTHAVETAPGARILHISGQVGVTPDGRIAQGFAAQCAQIWKNIEGILKAAGMEIGDLIRVTTYLVNAADIAESRAQRAAAIGDHRPASTLLVISGLASPEYVVEIEAWAAKDPAPAKPARAAGAGARAKTKPKARKKAPAKGRGSRRR